MTVSSLNKEIDALRAMEDMLIANNTSIANVRTNAPHMASICQAIAYLVLIEQKRLTDPSGVK